MKTIWLATDLSDSAELPWVHALKLCLDTGTDLDVLHVSDADPDWSQLPTVRRVLTRWGVISNDATLEAFQSLGFKVHLRALQGQRPEGLLEAMAEVHAPDLVIVGTHRRQGVQQWWQGSVAEGIARHAPKATLVTPDGCRPFVQPDDGACTLKRVLIPVGESGVQGAVDAATTLVVSMGEDPVEFVYLHVGEIGDIPQLTLPRNDSITHRTVNVRDGEVVTAVVERAISQRVDLIAMATAGHDSWQDTLFGSRTERVIREAPCPVLVAPLRT